MGNGERRIGGDKDWISGRKTLKMRPVISGHIALSDMWVGGFLSHL